MQFPKEVYSVIKKAVATHGDDIDGAIAMALAEVKELDNYVQLVEILVEQTIQTLVYEERHKCTVKTKREIGAYNYRAKVQMGDSKIVKDVCQKIYGMYIGGRTLGSIMGEDIPKLLASERQIRDGHSFNVKMLERIEPLAKPGKTVQEVVKGRIKDIYYEAREEVYPDSPEEEEDAA
jgi:hypothetical protein